MWSVLIRIGTAAVGLVSRANGGPNSKARAGGFVGALPGIVDVVREVSQGELGAAFWTGLVSGAAPQVEQLGALVGQVVIGGVIGWGITWLAAANNPALDQARKR